MNFKDFHEELTAELTEGKLPKINDIIYDVENNKIGTVKKVNKKLVTLSTGDEVNSDSFYKENNKWVVEL